MVNSKISHGKTYKISTHNINYDSSDWLRLRHHLPLYLVRTITWIWEETIKRDTRFRHLTSSCLLDQRYFRSRRPWLCRIDSRQQGKLLGASWGCYQWMGPLRCWLPRWSSATATATVTCWTNGEWLRLGAMASLLILYRGCRDLQQARSSKHGKKSSFNHGEKKKKKVILILCQW